MAERRSKRFVPHVWTVAEIQRLPEFGAGMGWFYGLVRHRRRLVIPAEVLPGMGYTTPFIRDVLCQPWRFLADLWRYRPLPPSVFQNTHATNTHVRLSAGSSSAASGRTDGP